MGPRRIIRLGVAGLFALAAVPAQLSAATIKVTTTADDAIRNGNCTLREAVIAANTDTAVDRCPAGAGPDLIIVPAGTYLLSLAGPSEDSGLAGDLDISSVVTIRGAGAASTTVDGGSFQGYLSHRVFDVALSGTLVVSGVTIRRGVCQGGGGIRNAGTLTVRDSRLEDNIASEAADFCPGAGGGGAIYNTGQLSIVRSTLSRNEVHGVLGPFDVAYPGGAILNRGTALIDTSTLTANRAAAGGGIHNSGRLQVEDSEISRNGARFWSAGLDNSGEASLLRTTISGNVDGGILNGGGSLVLRNVTLSGNFSARVAGSVHITGGTVDIISSTIADNSSSRAPDCPGGAPCPLPVAGIAGPARLLNTIVSNPGYGDCWDPVTSLGNNLDGDGSCGFTASGDLPDTDPLLGPLQDNGGPTRTHALLPGSPAIDHIPRQQCAAETDQRGVRRPQPDPKWSLCDIGAYEFRPEGDLVSNVDVGNPVDEALHDLEGWGGINPGLLPSEIDADRTSRYQLLRGSNSLTIAVPSPGAPHTLSFRTEDGVCDDSFDVHVAGDWLYSYRAEVRPSTFFPLHQVEVPGSRLQGATVRITFINAATDSCGLAAVYFVRLTAGANPAR